MSREEQTVEQVLAFHCAPSLAGIKPADLIAWPVDGPGAPLLADYDRLLSARGIRIALLHWRADGCALVLVYRPARLAGWLARPDVSAMLAQEGYPVDGGLEAMLSALRHRLEGTDFPHEIGLFLGYPPVDVEGFRRNGGRNCKLCGPWKVYGPVEEARQRFRTFHRCRAALCRRVASGMTLAQLFPAV